ncbi:hypothetical protein, partial [Salmonella sp. s55004]|uniref:hypothetical protein n=1 Tax=Salmonella sp. s55004 TaxID=3159675 RepID=UPI00397EA1CC
GLAKNILCWSVLHKMATATKFIQILRNFLVGRNLQVKYNNRTIPEIAPRTIPEANLPDGPSHKLSANYYLSRDGRREVNPNTVVYSNMKHLAERSTEGETASTTKRKIVSLGQMPSWKLSTDEPYL